MTVLAARLRFGALLALRAFVIVVLTLALITYITGEAPFGIDPRVLTALRNAIILIWAAAAIVRHVRSRATKHEVA